MMPAVDDRSLLQEIHAEIQPLVGQGRLPASIPPLAAVPRDRFAMVLRRVDGREAAVGHAAEPLSIQSISKILILTLAMQLEGDGIWTRVYREPSGNPYNSLVQLEREEGIPRNPFINAGAITLTDLILSRLDDPAGAVRDLARRSAGNQSLDFDLEVAAAEAATGHRNRALAHFLKAFGNLHNDVDRVLDAYFRICSLSMSCQDLAAAFAFLASGGQSADGTSEIATRRQVKRINAVMLTCGVYDSAGDFAYRVGLPGKSGVGGGIVAVMPGRFTVAVWSPGLDETGNSLAGTMALELLTTKLGVSVF